MRDGAHETNRVLVALVDVSARVAADVAGGGAGADVFANGEIQLF